MARKSDTIAINNPELDRRVKLTAEDKEVIHANKGGLSQRKLAALYGVSRRTIQFILDPEKLEQNKQRRAERGGSKVYYDKDKHAISMKEHRNYKKELYQTNQIGLPE